VSRAAFVAIRPNARDYCAPRVESFVCSSTPSATFLRNRFSARHDFRVPIREPFAFAGDRGCHTAALACHCRPPAIRVPAPSIAPGLSKMRCQAIVCERACGSGSLHSSELFPFSSQNLLGMSALCQSRTTPAVRSKNQLRGRAARLRRCGSP